MMFTPLKSKGSLIQGFQRLAPRAVLLAALLLGAAQPTPTPAMRAVPSVKLAPDAPSAAGPITSNTNDQSLPAVAYNSQTSEYLVVWEHEFSGSDHDIYARRVSNTGIPLGSEIAIETSTDFESNPDVSYNPNSGEYLVVYQSTDASLNQDVHMKRLGADGVPIEGAVAIANSTDDESNPAVAAHPTAPNGYLVVYQHRAFTAEQNDIHGRLVGIDGTLGSVITIADGIQDEAFPDIAAGEIYMVAWQMQDLESGDNDYEIHAHGVEPDGTLTFSEMPLADWDYDQLYPSVAYDSNNAQFLVAWEDHHWGFGDDWDIYGQLLDAAGAKIGGNIGIAYEGSQHRRRPNVAYVEGVDEYLVTYEYEYGATDHDIYRRRVTSDGSLVGAELVISNSGYEELTPAAACNGDIACLVAWADSRDAATQGINIYGDIVQAPFFSGNVSEDIGEASLPLSGVAVELYCSSNSADLGTLMNETLTDVSGGYGLLAGNQCTFYNLVQHNLPHYRSVSATSSGGTVKDPDWIQYSSPLGGAALSGNDFLDVYDDTPPQFISGPTVSGITQDSALITWETDEPSDTTLRYGTSAGELNLEVSDPGMASTHVVNLSGLSPASTYAFVAQSSDPYGNTAQSAPGTFETQPPADSYSPVLSLFDPGTVSGTVTFTASATDDTGVSKVIFYLDDQPKFIDYSPPYEYTLDSTIYDNGPHAIRAQAIDLVGQEGDQSIMADFSNLKDSSWPTVNITAPGNGATVSGIVKVTAQLSDDTGIISARFFVDGDYQQFEPYSVDNPPTNPTVTFDWDTRGLQNNTIYTLKIVAFDKEGKYGEGSVNVTVLNVAPPPPPSPPWLEVSGHVVLRNQNKFAVLITIKNTGDAEARNVRVIDGMYGFQPIAKNDATADIRPEYNPVGRWSYADIHAKSAIPAKDSRIYAFYAIPYLLNPNPQTPSIGFYIDLNWDSPTQSGYHHAVFLPVGTAVGGETIPQAHNAALKTADYLIVTNPYRLFAIHNPSYYQGDSQERRHANEVLSNMAELAAYQGGVLAYNHTYNSESLRDLIKVGGAWSNKLAPGWTSKGYMLLVGETNILSAWWRSYGTVETTKGDTQLITSYTDYPYGSTFGDETRPEISIARIIGNNPFYLNRNLQTHIKRLKGDLGYSFSGQSMYLVSGFNQGVGGGADNIDFKTERNKVANKLAGYKVLLHTPNLAVYDTGGKIDVVATTNQITSTLLSSFAGQDIIFLAGHGNAGSWDGLSAGALHKANDPFGNSTPFVFASSCSTGMYEQGNGHSLAEVFLYQEAGAYLGAIKHGLCEDGHCPNADLFVSKWDKSTPFAKALRDTKNALGTNVFDRYWNGIYNLFGEAKFGVVGGYGGALPDAPGAWASAPTGVVDIPIPAYAITHTQDGDYVSIPGGLSYIQPGEPTLPAYQAAYEYPAGTQVQSVTMVDRSAPETLTGLDIPTTTLAIPGGAAILPRAGDSDAGWRPEQDFEWFVYENPLTTTLAIRIYPFQYNSQSGEGRFYDHYSFDIQTTTSSVEITGLEMADPQQGGERPSQGETLTFDLEIDNSGIAAEDVAVFASIREAASGAFVDGLPLKTLKGLHGPAAYTAYWNTSGFDPGDYTFLVELRTPDGSLLDQYMQSFQVGYREMQLLSLTGTPAIFDPGEAVQLAVDLENTGTRPISATVVLEIHDPASGMITSFSLPVSELQSSETGHVETAWDTSGLAPGSYFVVAYVQYDGLVSEPLSVELVAPAKIYLPLVVR